MGWAWSTPTQWCTELPRQSSPNMPFLLPRQRISNTGRDADQNHIQENRPGLSLVSKQAEETPELQASIQEAVSGCHCFIRRNTVGNALWLGRTGASCEQTRGHDPR